MSLPAAGTEMTRAIKHHQKFEGHTSTIEGVIHLPGGHRIMTCARDGSLRVWNLESGKQIDNDWRDGESEVYSIALSPDGQKVVSGSGDGTMRLWDMDTGKVITKWTRHENGIPSLCWNGDGRRILSGCSDGTTKLWDVDTGKVILAIKTGFNDVWAVVYSPDKTMIATGGSIRKDAGGAKERREEEEEYIKIWDSKTGKLVTNLKGDRRRVYCIAWTGSTLVSGSMDSTVRTWNTTTWQQINVFTGHTDRVYGVAISPNGRILASASMDNTARLWNLEKGQPIGLPLQHADVVKCVSFSTDGKLLVTGCWDNNAYTWDVSAIVRKVGLDDLLLNPNGTKSLLDADATRRPGQRRRRDNINPDRPLPPGFFDDSSRHPRPSERRPLSPSSARQHHVAGNLSSHQRALLGRISSLFRRNHYNTHDTRSRLHLLQYPFFHPLRRQNVESIELQEHRSAVVDVPFTRGNPRNVSAAQVRMKKEKEKAKNAKNAKNAGTGSLRPPQSGAQQPGGAAQVQPSSELHPAVATSSTTPVVAATQPAVSPSTNSLPNAMIPHAGRWIRFWLFFCCASAQYTDSHH